MKIADKTVSTNLGFCSSGICANAANVDVMDGKIVRIRPLHYDELYTKDDLNYWTLEKDDKVFEPGMQSFIGPFSLSYKKRAYSKNRVPYPLIRVDWDPHGERHPETRGISKYRRISWDEATDIIAEEIKRIQEDYGPFSIYCQGEGHGESKNVAGGHGCQISMFDFIGRCTAQCRQTDSWEGWYWGAKHIWGMDPIGEQRWQRNVFKDITENGDAVLFWGADPETTPLGWGGQQASRMCFWFNDIGVKSIFICPDVNYTGAIHADKWIPVLPNTDAALQLAIAYVWITEDLYDKEYIATHADGFDWFQQYVLGYLDDNIPKTPEWAETKCKVPAYTIKALARYWAHHNVSIGHGNGGGYIRSAFSHEPGRLEVALLGMQGLGKPGANQFKFLEWLLFHNPDYSPLPVSDIQPSVEAAFHGWKLDPGPSHIIKTRLHEAILTATKEKPLKWYCTGLSLMPVKDQFVQYQYPVEGSELIHMIWSDAPCWSNCWNNGNMYHDSIHDPSIETIIVQHPWMENDTKFADIILPICTILECEDISTDSQNGQNALLLYQEKPIDPLTDSVTDYEAVQLVAEKLERYGGIYEGLVRKYTNGRSYEDWIKWGYITSGIGHDVKFDDFKKQRFYAAPYAKDWREDPHGMIGFYEDPENHPLQTPTGKLEYYSVPLAEHFPDDNIRGPYPKWIEKGDGHDDRWDSERAKLYPYLLVSNHPRWRVHAQHGDIPWTHEFPTGKIKGPDGYLYEPIWINPVDAVKHDIKQGDIVKIFNERGAVMGGAYVTERIMPGALSQDHGAREDLIQTGTGGLDRGGGNNLICPDKTSSKNASGEVTNSFLVGIEKVDVFELAKEYPEEFGREYDEAIGQIVDPWIVEE